MNTLKNIALTLIALVPIASWSADTVKLEDLTIMALGPLDGRAVIKTVDSKLQVVKVGDTLSGTQAIVTQVLGDKPVLEIGATGDSHKQMAWLIKPAKPGDKSTVQRFDCEAPQGKVTNVQVMKPVETTPKTKKC